MMDGRSALLQIERLSAAYGAAKVLENVSLQVASGEFVAIVGANGAGKTTLLKAIMGLIPAEGSVRLEGRELLQQPPYRRAALGVGYVPEGRHVFPNLTVEENLRVGAFRLQSPRTLTGQLTHVYDLFPRLRERHRQLAATLSGGEQQMLALGRALILEPRILIVDEVSLGLAPIVVDQLFAVFTQLHDNDTTILVAEQNAHKALQAADRAYVLETGQVALEGPTEELRTERRVIEAYLQSM